MTHLIRYSTIGLLWVAAALVGSGLHVSTAAAAALTFAVLWLAMSSMSGYGWPLVTALFWLCAGGTYISSLVEAVLFGVIPVERAVMDLVGGIATSLLAALGLVWAAGRFHAVETSGSPRTWQWRPAVAASVVFLVLYMVAGSIMLPFFRDFYVGRPMPGLPALVALQLVRGLVWVAIAFPCLRRIESRTRAVFVLAVTFAVLGAIAPLLPPNAAMPERIRLAHMVEMTMSHVLFGMFTAWVFTRRRVNPAQPGGNETADEGRGTRMDPEKIGVNRRASAVPLN